MEIRVSARAYLSGAEEIFFIIGAILLDRRFQCQARRRGDKLRPAIYALPVPGPATQSALFCSLSMWRQIDRSNSKKAVDLLSACTTKR